MKECRMTGCWGGFVGEGAGCLGGRRSPLGAAVLATLGDAGGECVHWVGATGKAVGGSVQCPRHWGPLQGIPLLLLLAETQACTSGLEMPLGRQLQQRGQGCPCLVDEGASTIPAPDTLSPDDAQSSLPC